MRLCLHKLMTPKYVLFMLSAKITLRETFFFLSLNEFGLCTSVHAQTDIFSSTSIHILVYNAQIRKEGSRGIVTLELRPSRELKVHGFDLIFSQRTQIVRMSSLKLSKK